LGMGSIGSQMLVNAMLAGRKTEHRSMPRKWMHGRLGGKVEVYLKTEISHHRCRGIPVKAKPAS
jgi:hypothetical protein